MPKTPKGKKRKVVHKEEKTKKLPKRLKFEDDADNIEAKSALSSSESEGEDDEDYLEKDEVTNLDKMLEKNAKKNNLSAFNVKSILHVSINISRNVVVRLFWFVCMFYVDFNSTWPMKYMISMIKISCYQYQFMLVNQLMFAN